MAEYSFDIGGPGLEVTVELGTPVPPVEFDLQTGISGPPGPRGPQGEPGQGIHYKGEVDSCAFLPEESAPGDAWYSREDEMLYVYGEDGYPSPGQGIPYKGRDGKDGSSLLIMDGIYSKPGSPSTYPDIPAFKDTEVGWAYVVDDGDDGTGTDLYFHGDGGQTWTVVKGWGGVPGPPGPPGTPAELPLPKKDGGFGEDVSPLLAEENAGKHLAVSEDGGIMAMDVLEPDGETVTGEGGTLSVMPGVFAEKSHEHAVSDVDGLDGRLASLLPLSGGSLTGPLTLATPLGTASGGTGNTSGLAASATKLATARSVRANLGSTAAAPFDGTADIAPGVTGTLPLANGGTGATTAAAARTALGVNTRLESWPVGVVYSSYVSTSPASLIGGSWTAITGRFPYYNAGTGTGGAATHSHRYALAMRAYYGAAVGNDDDILHAYDFVKANWTNAKPVRAGNGTVNNNLATSSKGSAYTIIETGDVRTSAESTYPPYQTLYAWRRTA